MTTFFTLDSSLDSSLDSAFDDLTADDFVSATATPSIDMLNPAQVCERLAITSAALLDLVNSGELAAYDLGDGIRFRVTHVERMVHALIAA